MKITKAQTAEPQNINDTSAKQKKQLLLIKPHKEVEEAISTKDGPEINFARLSKEQNPRLHDTATLKTRRGRRAGGTNR